MKKELPIKIGENTIIRYKRCNPYQKFFPNFKPLITPTRTESFDSDIHIGINGKVKNPIFGI